MPEVVLASGEKVVPYIVGSLSRPQQTTRQLIAEPRLKTLCWQFVLVAAVVSAIAGIAYDLYLYSYRGERIATIFLPEEYTVWNLVLEAGIGFGVVIGSYVVTRFVWSRLFGYGNQANAISAAAAMSFGPTIILDPLIEITEAVQGTLELTPTLTVIGIYSLATLLMSAVYFSAALEITYLKAFVLSTCNMIVFLVSAMVILFAVAIILIRFSMQASL